MYYTRVEFCSFRLRDNYFIPIWNVLTLYLKSYQKVNVDSAISPDLISVPRGAISIVANVRRPRPGTLHILPRTQCARLMYWGVTRTLINEPLLPHGPSQNSQDAPRLYRRQEIANSRHQPPAPGPGPRLRPSREARHHRPRRGCARRRSNIISIDDGNTITLSREFDRAAKL